MVIASGYTKFKKKCCAEHGDAVHKGQQEKRHSCKGAACMAEKRRPGKGKPRKGIPVWPKKDGQERGNYEDFRSQPFDKGLW